MSTELVTVDNQAVNSFRQRLRSIPKEEIRSRQGRGGEWYNYTDGPYVIRTLNDIFGWDWDFEADNEELLYFDNLPFEVRCRGKLTVRVEGRTLIKIQYGSMQVEFRKDKDGNIIAPVSLGDCFKGAATDALKKCAAMIEIALDLYDSDSEINTKTKPASSGPKRNNNSESATLKMNEGPEGELDKLLYAHCLAEKKIDRNAIPFFNAFYANLSLEEKQAKVKELRLQNERTKDEILESIEISSNELTELKIKAQDITNVVNVMTRGESMLECSVDILLKIEQRLKQMLERERAKKAA